MKKLKDWEVIESSLQTDSEELLSAEMISEYRSLKKTRELLQKLPMPPLSLKLQSDLLKLTQQQNKERKIRYWPSYLWQPAMALLSLFLLGFLFYGYFLKEEPRVVDSKIETVNSGSLFLGNNARSAKIPNDVIWQINLQKQRNRQLDQQFRQLLNRHGARLVVSNSKRSRYNNRQEFRIPQKNLVRVKEGLPNRLRRHIRQNPFFKKPANGQAKIILISQ